jgi:small-conductance mechanosensitive channel
MSRASPPPATRGPWQPRFSIGSLLLTMLVFAVMASAGGYLVRALREGDRWYQLVFLLITLAAPLLLMVLVSLTHAAVTRRRKR